MMVARSTKVFMDLFVYLVLLCRLWSIKATQKKQYLLFFVYSGHSGKSSVYILEYFFSLKKDAMRDEPNLNLCVLHIRKSLNRLQSISWIKLQKLQ